MTNKQIAEWLRSKKCNLFAENKDINAYPMTLTNPQERTIAFTSMGVTLNTLLEGLAVELELKEINKEDSNDK